MLEIQTMVSLLDTIGSKSACKSRKLCMNKGPGGSSISLISAITLSMLYQIIFI